MFKLTDEAMFVTQEIFQETWVIVRKVLNQDVLIYFLH